MTVTVYDCFTHEFVRVVANEDAVPSHKRHHEEMVSCKHRFIVDGPCHIRIDWLWRVAADEDRLRTLDLSVPLLDMVAASMSM